MKTGLASAPLVLRVAPDPVVRRSPRRSPLEAASVSGVDLARRRHAFHARNEEYLREGFDRLAAAHLVAQVAGAPSGPALDVGTGKGLLAIALARLGLEVVSVDIDREEQVLAALLAGEAGVDGRIEFVAGDAASLSQADEHFGCAAMMDVLHHLADPRPVLAEMIRVVRTGGVLIAADFSREGFEIVARVHRKSGREHPESGATMAAARSFLARQGLRCVAERHGHCQEVVAFLKEPRSRA